MPANQVRYGTPLTTRESEVAMAYSLDHDKKSIAADLGISFHTAHRHLAHAYIKLGINSQLQLVAWMMRSGLVTAEQVQGIAPRGRYHDGTR